MPGIIEAVTAVFGVIVILLKLILAKTDAKQDVKKSKFDLGVSELHTANQRMRLPVDQREPPPL